MTDWLQVLDVQWIYLFMAIDFCARFSRKRDKILWRNWLGGVFANMTNSDALFTFSFVVDRLEFINETYCVVARRLVSCSICSEHYSCRTSPSSVSVCCTVGSPFRIDVCHLCCCLGFVGKSKFQNKKTLKQKVTLLIRFRNVFFFIFLVLILWNKYFYCDGSQIGTPISHFFALWSYPISHTGKFDMKPL